MRLTLAIATAAAALAACASTGGPAPSVLSTSGAAGAAPGTDLLARYRQYRTGPGPHLDFETWRRQFGTPTDYTGAGP
jgi:hypothetical protein